MVILRISKKLINILESFLIKLKRKTTPGIIFTSKDKEYKDYEIGEYTYGFPKIIKYDNNSKLKIGKFCSIAQEVRILLGGEHYLSRISTYPLKTLFNQQKKDNFSKGNVIIGNDVWIGYGATILSGVIIGDGAVIGANAVIAKSVEPYSIVVGNPGKEIKKRFDNKTIKTLLELKWWDWDTKKIKNNLNLLTNSPNLKAIKKFL